MERHRNTWIMAVVVTGLVSAACRTPFPGHGHHRPHDPHPPVVAPVADIAALDLVRPRVELRLADIPVVQQRLDRTPYSTLLRVPRPRSPRPRHLRPPIRSTAG